jgi:Protein of unknown function (DUF3618)
MNAQAGGTDPGSKSATEIEREVQQSRAEVEQTLDAIQARLSPGQLLDQAVDYLREGRGVEFARNLGDSITQNPIPLAGRGRAGLDDARRPALRAHWRPSGIAVLGR